MYSNVSFLKSFSNFNIIAAFKERNLRMDFLFRVTSLLVPFSPHPHCLAENM